MFPIRLLIALICAFAGICQQALADKRVALVVGIDRYDNLPAAQQLQRAVSDARAVAATLQELGYELIGGKAGENVSRAEFNALWQKLLDRVETGDTVAVYFSGHGVEIEGLNFLIPRDIPAVSYGRQEQIKRESLSVFEFLLDLRKRKPGVSLVILDACRDHPLVPEGERSTAGAKGGLAKMDAPVGTFVMYAAGAGETALDRLPGSDPDRNSVYTRKLLPLLKTKGLPLTDLARKLRAEVHALAASVPHPQTPAYYDGVLGEFCVAGCDKSEVAAAPAITPAERLADKRAAELFEEYGRPKPPAGAPGLAPALEQVLKPQLEAEAAWLAIEHSNNPNVIEAFITRYGNTFYGQVAKSRLVEMQLQEATDAVSLETPEAAAKANVRAPTAKLDQPADGGLPAKTPARLGNLSGIWRGHAVVDGREHPVALHLSQSGKSVTGRVVLSLPDGGKATSYSVKGGADGNVLRFSGARFFERHGTNWCLPGVTLHVDGTSAPRRLSGAWGENNIPGGCPQGVGGALVLREQ